MNNTINDAVNKLDKVLAETPVDWVAFDAVLADVEDINALDEEYEETILSEIIRDGECYKNGECLPEIIRHFLACGYDISANEGRNGGLALSALCWSSYDRYILDAAKVLMNAGAPVVYHSKENDPGEPEGLFGDLDWKISGAWMVDKDFEYANILLAYEAMAKAKMAGKDYNAIDSYFACIGEKLTSVSAVKCGETITLQKDENIAVFTEPIILWFGEKPLVADCYTEYVVNPVYSEDRKGEFVDVTSIFSELVGTELKEVRYLGTTICYFEFSNGNRVIFSSREIGDRKRVGTFEIRAGENAAIEKLSIDGICGIKGVTFASTVTDYHEDAIALFCGYDAYLLHIFPGPVGKYQMGLCPCSKELLTDYTRQYPLREPENIACFYEKGCLTAVRFQFSEGLLYLKTTEYYKIEVQLSDYLYDPLEFLHLPRKAENGDAGKHMEFQRRR